MTLINGPRIIFISAHERRQPQYRANPPRIEPKERSVSNSELSVRAYLLAFAAMPPLSIPWHAVYGPEVHNSSARGAMVDRGCAPHDQEQVNWLQSKCAVAESGERSIYYIICQLIRWQTRGEEFRIIHHRGRGGAEQRTWAWSDRESVLGGDYTALQRELWWPITGAGEEQEVEVICWRKETDEPIAVHQ